MPYSLDTSSILDAWVRRYPPDVVPSLWKNMDDAIRKGEIFAIEEVLRELQRKDDDVYKWVKEREEMIVSIDDEIQGYLVDIYVQIWAIS